MGHYEAPLQAWQGAAQHMGRSDNPYATPLPDRSGEAARLQASLRTEVDNEGETADVTMEAAACSGAKRDREQRSPARTMRSVEFVIKSPPRKQSAVANSCTLSFPSPATLLDRDVHDIIATHTSIGALCVKAIGRYSMRGIIDTQVNTVTFSSVEATTTALTELGSAVGSDNRISDAVQRRVDPPPLPSDISSHLDACVSARPFVMPDYCLIKRCAHHCDQKQRTFPDWQSMEAHWNHYHQDYLECFAADQGNKLKWLGMKRCGRPGCSHVSLSRHSWEVHHSMCKEQVAPTRGATIGETTASHFGTQHGGNVDAHAPVEEKNDDDNSTTSSAESVTPQLEQWESRYGVAFAMLGEEDKIILFQDLKGRATALTADEAIDAAARIRLARRTSSSPSNL